MLNSECDVSGPRPLNPAFWTPNFGLLLLLRVHGGVVAFQVVTYQALGFIPERFCVEAEKTPDVGAGGELAEILRFDELDIACAELRHIGDIPDGDVPLFPQHLDGRNR